MSKNSADRAATDHAMRFIDAWLGHWFAGSGLPGLSITVREGDKILMNKAWGHADLAKRKKLTTRHSFRLASHSKMFTGVAMAKLQEKGLLHFDDPAAKYLPWLRKKPGMENVTIRQLLAHTAKIARDGETPYWNGPGKFADAATLRKNMRRVDSPIKNIKYSNWGYGLLGLIIEEVSGKSYARFMKDEIIDPLGLESTTAEYNAAIGRSMAKGYTSPWKSKRQPLSPKTLTRALAAATGLCGTPSDLSRFVQSQARPVRDVIGPAAKGELGKRFNKISRDEYYGLGRMICKVGAHTITGHDGVFPGFRSSSAACGELDLAVSVVINADDGKPYPIVENIFKTILYFREHQLHAGKRSQKDMGGQYGGAWVAFNKANELQIFDLWDLDPASELKPGSTMSLRYPQTGPGSYRIEGDHPFGHEGESVTFTRKRKETLLNFAGSISVKPGN